MPECINRWWGYCTLNKEKDEKKEIEMSFGVKEGKVFGLGIDKLGCYTISGVSNDISTPERPFMSRIDMKFCYIEGWEIYVSGVLWNQQLNGAWFSNANYGKICIRMETQFCPDDYFHIAKSF
jgi:hypothetical protein